MGTAFVDWPHLAEAHFVEGQASTIVCRLTHLRSTPSAASLLSCAAVSLSGGRQERQDDVAER